MVSLSKDQLKKLALHTAGISAILLETHITPEPPDEACEPLHDTPFRETPPQFSALDYFESTDQQRERTLSRLCGRWMAGNNRCGIEISRAGEHFILTYLKRNGNPSGERYVLIWLDGDILYYGYQDRIAILALNGENDTLMISPGVDYTRVTEPEK